MNQYFMLKALILLQKQIEYHNYHTNKNSHSVPNKLAHIVIQKKIIHALCHYFFLPCDVPILHVQIKSFKNFGSLELEWVDFFNYFVDFFDSQEG